MDNALALQIRPYQTPNLAQMYGQVQDIQMNRMRMAEAEEVNRERNALRELVASGVDVNTPEGLNQLRQRAPLLARTTERENVGLAQARAQAQTATIQAFRSMLPGVRDQAGYTAWRAGAVQAMPQFASMIPERYSPDTVLRLAEGADGLVRRMTRQPDEFTRAAVAAGVQPGTPEFQAFARQRLERMAAGDRPPPGPVTVAPGGTLVDPRTGQVVFTAPERATERDRRIDDIMATHRVDRATASGIVDGIIRVVTDPVTGEHTFANTLTQQVAPANAAAASGAPAAAPMPPAATPAPAPAAAATSPATPPQTLWQASEMPMTTGVAPAVAQAVQNIAGQVGIQVVPPEMTERRQMFTTAQRDLIRALANNPRFPVAEMESIQREINLEPGVFVDPQSLQARMRSVDASLRTRLQNEERAAANRTLPVESRRNAASAANEIRNFLAIMGVPPREAAPAPPREAAPAPPREAAPAPRRATIDRRVQTGAVPGAPPIGTVEDGFEFLGGNPADQRNWRRQ
jgi:hypothetical protein